MFNKDDYNTEMGLDPLTIYMDTQEFERAKQFVNYIHSLDKTEENGLNRITTSNGEYLYYNNIDKLPLAKGDYYYNGILFEYKTLRDLELSIFNNDDDRLNRQVDDVLKDPSINMYIIICPCLNEFDFSKDGDCKRFENLKNFFNQFIPLHVHFIPTTSQEIAFRDMLNIWRGSKSSVNLFTLNKKYRLNPFLTLLSSLPILNHNQANAIFKQFPYCYPEEIKQLTVDDIANVKFGKKRCGKPKAEKIINQIRIWFPNRFSANKKTNFHPIEWEEVKIF